MMNWIERASAELRWKFCMIWGEKTTTVKDQQGTWTRIGDGRRTPASN